MADDTLPVQSGILDPLVGMGFFSPNMSLEEIKRRRAIGAALASRARPFPKTVGEGLTALGESFGERLAENRLVEAEKGYNERYDKAAGTPVATAADALPPIAAVPPGPVGAVPSPAPPAPAGPMASRAPIYQALAGPEPARPMVTANASMNTGAAPAGPMPNGATFAEEGGPNPPTVSRDIRPMVMAQAAPRGAPPAAPIQPPAAPGGTLEPFIPPDPGPMPPPPARSERMTPNEQRWQNIQRQFPGDPRAEREFKQAHELGKAARDAEYEREKREHDVRVQEWVRARTERDAAIRGREGSRLDLTTKAATATKAQEEEATRIRLGGVPESEFLAGLKEGTKDTKNILGATASIRGLQKDLVAGNMFTGATAEAELAAAKAFAALGGPPNPKIAPTEKFKAMVATITAQARQMLAGGANISDKDLEKAETAAGGNIKLEADSIKGIMDATERLNAQMAVAHHAKIKTYTGDDPIRQKNAYGLYGIPGMDQVVPQSSVKELRDLVLAEPANRAAIMKEFDDDYHTPGLAARILGSRR